MLKNFVSAIKFYLENTNSNYGFLPAKTEMLPCGFESVWNLPFIKPVFSMYAVRNSIIISLKTPDDIADDYRFKCELSKKGFFVPLSSVEPDFCSPQLGGAPREWESFRFENGRFFSAFTDKENGRECHTAFCIGADFEMSLRETPQNTKFVLSSEKLMPSRTYHIVFSLSKDSVSADKLCSDIIKNADALIAEQKNRYRKVAVRAPQFKCSNKELSDFMALSPMYNESLKVLDHPGALRANTKHYMPWGSDSLYRGYLIVVLICILKNNMSRMVRISSIISETAACIIEG